MRSRRVSAEEIASHGAEQLLGAVLLAPIRLEDKLVAKGTRLDAPLAEALKQAALDRRLQAALRLGWADPGDLHEDDAARRLAEAVAGPGLTVGSPSQSRVDLTAQVDGVLRIQVEGLAQLNRIDPLEVFTLFHGQAIRQGQVVAGVKVAPHLIATAIVQAGEQVAHAYAPLIRVDPYRSLEVAAIAVETLTPGALERFDHSAGTKVRSLGGRFVGTTHVPGEANDRAAGTLTEVLRAHAITRGVPILLVGGVSAGDPLSPFYEALLQLGGGVLRRGVPAHPGSMIWLAALGETTLLGLPQCGMFSMATAADLVLPRLLTGERVTADTLADLGHGGLLGREMRFRFPEYARDLETPATG
jgi:hypothetical protein